MAAQSDPLIPGAPAADFSVPGIDGRPSREPRPHACPFPYPYDETQGIARTYGAVCTPDFAGFHGRPELRTELNTQHAEIR